MLTLRVDSGDYVAIGDDIIVQVYQSKNSTLTLSIDAPREVSIVRGELHDKQAGRPRSIQQRWENHPPKKDFVKRPARQD